jgi:hypothetical protein
MWLCPRSVKAAIDFPFDICTDPDTHVCCSPYLNYVDFSLIFRIVFRGPEKCSWSGSACWLFLVILDGNKSWGCTWCLRYVPLCAMFLHIAQFLDAQPLYPLSVFIFYSCIQMFFLEINTSVFIYEFIFFLKRFDQIPVLLSCFELAKIFSFMCQCHLWLLIVLFDSVSLWWIIQFGYFNYNLHGQYAWITVLPISLAGETSSKMPFFSCNLHVFHMHGSHFVYFVGLSSLVSNFRRIFNDRFRRNSTVDSDAISCLSC